MITTDPVASTAVCGLCGGKGYLLGQSYNEVDIPAGWVPVQRCDSCEQFDGDEEAAHAAAAGEHAHGVELFGRLDALGDFAICVDFDAAGAAK